MTAEPELVEGDGVLTYMIFENQRWTPFRGWSHKGLFPTERNRWTNSRGRETGRDIFLKMGWMWDGDWVVDTAAEDVDASGWMYAFTFSNKDGTWTNSRHKKHFVRRRRWIRRALLQAGGSSPHPQPQPQQTRDATEAVPEDVPKPASSSSSHEYVTPIEQARAIGCCVAEDARPLSMNRCRQRRKVIPPPVPCFSDVVDEEKWQRRSEDAWVTLEAIPFIKCVQLQQVPSDMGERVSFVGLLNRIMFAIVELRIYLSRQANRIQRERGPLGDHGEGQEPHSERYWWRALLDQKLSIKPLALLTSPSDADLLAEAKRLATQIRQLKEQRQRCT